MATEYQAGTNIAIIGTLSDVVDGVVTQITDLEGVEISALIRNEKNNVQLFFTNKEGLPADGAIEINNEYYSFVINNLQSAKLVGDNYIEIAIMVNEGLKIGSTRHLSYFKVNDNLIHRKL